MAIRRRRRFSPSSSRFRPSFSSLRFRASDLPDAMSPRELAWAPTGSYSVSSAAALAALDPLALESSFPLDLGLLQPGANRNYPVELPTAAPTRFFYPTLRPALWSGSSLSKRRIPLFLTLPARAAVCVSRKERRRSLFASGVAGKRGSAPGPYRRGEFSSVSCR